MDKTESDVWSTVQALNRCWTCGDLSQLDKLRDFFHERMVAVTPGNRYRLEGREACINGWSAFARNVVIGRWREYDPHVTVFGHTAVVSYYYDLTGEIQRNRVSFSGRDMLTLIRENGRWQVVADQFSPFPQN